MARERAATHGPRAAPSVLVVDDDAVMRRLCADTLAPEFGVLEAANGQEALRRLYAERPAVTLLDIGMPVMDGWETLRRIRDLTDAPVILLTARDGDHDVIRGLDNGARDYITKPFHPAQLLARVRAAIRDSHRAGQALAGVENVLSFDEGHLVVDCIRRLAVVDGREVELSATEYRLLEVLARHPRQVLSTDQLLDEVWGPEYVGESGYVRTYIGILRKKIEPNTRQPRYLHVRRGLGYYFEPDGAAE